MQLAHRVAEYLDELTRFPDRHVGGPGNREATALFARVAEECGLEVERREFDCLEWEWGAATLQVGDASFDLHVGPYSKPVAAEAPLVTATTVEELEALDSGDVVLLLLGRIASGQLMPKNFVWYNPEEHKRVYRALESLAPVAVIAATGRDPELVGGQYPFPLFEDGDLEVPNAYLTDVAGARLAEHAGSRASVRIESERVPTTAEHVVAYKRGERPGRVVLSAHIDSRKGSPGALDNASGVATLLAVAHLLEGAWDGPTVEFVPFNGEDNYANPGEMLWAADNAGRLGDVILGINIDDSGQAGHANDVSFYGVPEEISSAVRSAAAGRAGIGFGPEWFQGDHMLLVQSGVPAIAIASSGMMEFMATYAHGPDDTVGLADPELIAQTAAFVHDVVSRLARG